MVNLKSRPCRDFLMLMDSSEDATYCNCLKIVIDSYKKWWIEISQEKLVKEINIYM